MPKAGGIDFITFFATIVIARGATEFASEAMTGKSEQHA